MRPIVFFDLETTGVDVAKDRIVEISMVKVMPNGDKVTRTKKINPGIEIPSGASDVHGITNEDVKDAPSFKQLSKGISEFCTGCDLAGYNIMNFDLPLIVEEFGRCDMEFPDPDTKFVDVFTIYRLLNPRTLSACYEHYTGKNLDDAHSAEADTLATYEILQRMTIDEDIPQSIAELHDYCMDGKEIVDWAGKIIKEDGEYLYNFGKHKGKIVSSERDYAQWMLSGDFTKNTKDKIREILGL